ncbi:hypothetical protein MMG85_01670 [Pseudoxanthomonas sp. LH2527]|uniref:hypothetical protein n=1 Tax=Pseudoxanthomonas sp. LH2527 TaxID=2923249 RepID=UPI001F141BF7|nr:hypothetical protein [Pseudoxanthomonas sp. LH2527]MCH6482279.1 hypothetical protein [Pseudoxanthomonas sp. LH2527]
MASVLSAQCREEKKARFTDVFFQADVRPANPACSIVVRRCRRRRFPMPPRHDGQGKKVGRRC